MQIISFIIKKSKDILNKLKPLINKLKLEIFKFRFLNINNEKDAQNNIKLNQIYKEFELKTIS